MTQVAGSPRAREIKDVAQVRFIRGVVKRMGELHLSAYAAGLAYGAVFALVPMLALLVLLLGLFNAVDLVDRAMAELRTVLPAEMTKLLRDQLTSIAKTNNDGGLGVGVFVSAGVAIWGASGAMRRVMEALNVVHRAEETRSFVRKLGVSVAMALGAIVLIVATLLVTVIGGAVATRVFGVIGLGSTAAAAWTWVRWPIMLVLAWAGIAGAYRFAPCTRQVGGLATPGTIFATVGWVLFSVVFSWYVGGVGSVDATWGSVAGIIVLLLYLQYAGLIVLLGALIDVELYDANRTSSRLRRWLHAPPTRN
jgi:membrane protein